MTAFARGRRYLFGPLARRYHGEGIAILIVSGGVLVFLDHEGVSQVIGDLSGRSA